MLEPPAMMGMLRKSAAFLPRYYKFESISLQRGVTCELDFLGFPLASLHPEIAARTITSATNSFNIPEQSPSRGTHLWWMWPPLRDGREGPRIPRLRWIPI